MSNERTERLTAEFGPHIRTYAATYLPHQSADIEERALDFLIRFEEALPEDGLLLIVSLRLAELGCLSALDIQGDDPRFGASISRVHAEIPLLAAKLRPLPISPTRLIRRLIIWVRQIAGWQDARLLADMAAYHSMMKKLLSKEKKIVTPGSKQEQKP